MVFPTRSKFEEAVKDFAVEKGAEYTHLLQNGVFGGKLNIPDDMHTAFLKLYTECIDTNHQLYVIEHKTQYYKFMIDVDLYNTIKDNSEDIVSHIQEVVYSLVSEWYTVYQSRLIISASENRNVKKNGKDFLKTGLHLIWPEVIVDNKTALQMRNIVIHSLTQKFGERHSENPWDDVIDSTIYKTNGLRMNYSWKMEECKCPDVDPEKKEQKCEICKGRKRVGAKRIYTPQYVLNGKGKKMASTLKKIIDNKKYGIFETSIRMPEEKECKIVIDQSKYPGLNEHVQTKKSHSLGLGGGVLNGKVIDSIHKKLIQPSEPIYKSVQNFIVKEFDGLYKKEDINELYKCQQGSYYIVGTKSKYCMNIEKEHKNNRIYFYIDKQNVYQKCLCTCITLDGRKHGMCKDYKSSGHKLSLSVKSKLYPNYKQHSHVSLKGMSENERLRQLNEYAFDIISDKKKHENMLIQKVKSEKKKSVQSK